jgi:hypothetical protein
MSYIRVASDFRKREIMRINNDMFYVEDENDWFLIGSICCCCSYWINKGKDVSLESFILDQIKGFPKPKIEKKNVYLCFFHGILPYKKGISYTTFTNVSYDELKEFFLLAKEMVLKDLLPQIIKLFFSMHITDKKRIKVQTYTTKKNGASTKELYLRPSPRYTYIFND